MKQVIGRSLFASSLLGTLWGLSVLGGPASTQAAPGALIWTNQLDAAGGSDRALAVVTKGSGVYTAGRVTNGSGNLDWLVRAQDAKTGALLWQDQFNLNNGRDEALAIGLAGKVLAAAGRVRSATSNDNWLVRAYDVKTGELLWQDQYDQAAGSDRANALAVCGKTIVAVGRVTNGAGDDDWFVRAYDSTTGAILWSDQFDPAGGDDEAVAVIGKGSKVYVGGSIVSGAGNDDWLVRAYDAKTGEVVWADQFDQASGDDVVTSLALQGSAVFAAGSVVNGADNRDFAVRAVNAKDGHLLWQDQYDLATDDDRAVGLAVQGKTLVAVGNASNLAGDTDFIVRTYDTGSGSLLWQDRYNPAGGNDGAVATTISSGSVLAVGFVTNSSDNSDWFVRAYASKTGEVQWTDQYDQSGRSDLATAIAPAGSKVFVAGEATNAAGNADWLTGAYSVK